MQPTAILRWALIAVGAVISFSSSLFAQDTAAPRSAGAVHRDETRLVVGPTAKTLSRRQSYFSLQLPLTPVFGMAVPFLATGLSDAFTVGGGVSLIPELGTNQVFYLAPKVRVWHTDRADAALGMLYANTLRAIGSADESPGFGVVYAVSTFGSPSFAFTSGLGLGFMGGEVSDKPLVLLGFAKSVSQRVSIISENWVVTGTPLLVPALAVRLANHQVTMDIAAITAVTSGLDMPITLILTVVHDLN